MTDQSGQVRLYDLDTDSPDEPTCATCETPGIVRAIDRSVIAAGMIQGEPMSSADPSSAADAKVSMVLSSLLTDRQVRGTTGTAIQGRPFRLMRPRRRTQSHTPVTDPESVNEFYDPVADPDEMFNQIEDSGCAAVRGELMAELYRQLRDRGDNSYHWMTPMREVGGTDDDSTIRPVQT